MAEVVVIAFEGVVIAERKMGKPHALGDLEIRSRLDQLRVLTQIRVSMCID